MSLGLSQDINHMTRDKKVVLTLSNPLNLYFFEVTSNTQESGVRYQSSKDLPLNFQYSLFTGLEARYEQLLGKIVAILLLFMLSNCIVSG